MLNKLKNRQNSNLKTTNQVDVEIGHLFSAVKKQIPGYLSVKIDNYNFDKDDVEFFGVEVKGGEVSGQGVSADKIRRQRSLKLALFNIKKLIESGQFTENIKEGVIMIDGKELGRDSIENNPSIYWG